MHNGRDLNPPSCLINQIQNPVSTSTGGVGRCQRWMQRLADAIWLIE
jgi:hypothetical protein